MKNILLIILVIIISTLLTANKTLAEDLPFTSKDMPLGQGYSSLSISHITFADKQIDPLEIDTFSKAGVESAKFTKYPTDDGVNNGLLISAESYYLIAPKIYVGGSIGYGESDTSYIFTLITTTTTVTTYSPDSETIFIPLELNIKYALDLGNDFVFSFGGGLSRNFIKEKMAGRQILGTDSDGQYILGPYRDYYRVKDWVNGMQLFAELFYRPEYENYFYGAKLSTKILDDFYTFSNRDYSHTSLSLFAGYYY